MHSYFRAIGFSRLQFKNEQNKIISSVIHDMTNRQEISIGANTKLVQISKNFGNGIGLSIIGECDQSNAFTLDHAFPYCLGTTVTMQSDIQIEAHHDKEAYSGVSDDYDLEMTLIYFLQNIVDYVKGTWLNDFYRIPKKVRLGALSIEGRVILGVHLESIANPYDKQPISSKDRRNLIIKAKSGDVDALESLTLDDMDKYSLISKRIKDEDIFTVVETFFMPYGIDNELYSILGIIEKIDKISNEISGENVYNLTVWCNDITLNVGINALDLQGEPAIGRRFKGIIWLQGQIDFL